MRPVGLDIAPGIAQIVLCRWASEKRVDELPERRLHVGSRVGPGVAEERRCVIVTATGRMVQERQGHEDVTFIDRRELTAAQARRPSRTSAASPLRMAKTAERRAKASSV